MLNEPPCIVYILYFFNYIVKVYIKTKLLYFINNLTTLSAELIFKAM